MMYKISSDINNSIKNVLTVNELSIDECKSILYKISALYVDSEKRGKWLWEKLSESEEISDNKGWSYIHNYVSDRACIMFFNQDEEIKMYKISNGKDLQFILSETSGYEFYITDDKCSYLLGFNHHDVLFGCGKAKEWIVSLKK